MRKIMNIGKKMSALILALSGLVASSLHSLPAEPWPQWRGPSFNGSATDEGFPTTFSKTDNVKWVVNLPGPPSWIGQTVTVRVRRAGPHSVWGERQASVDRGLSGA